ncbi:MAG: NAD(P)/FAD-dependent oxidoreductase [Acidimicrobiales bacterium]
MLTADVMVVGGGPAGVAAAITLARAGRDTVLIDRATFPRDKCCGDGLTTGALRRYEALGLDPASVSSWQPANDVWVRSPSGRLVEFPLPREQGTYAAIARRHELDAAFLDVARAAGVKVHDGHAVVAAEIRPDHVVVEAEGIGSLAARYAIAADGMWSPMRKFTGEADVAEGGPYLGEWHAFRQYFQAVANPAATDMWVWFDADLLPGYAWSFPLPGGRANVGFGVLRDGGTTGAAMRDLWRDLLARPHIVEVLGPDAEPEAPHKAWPIPARIGRSSLHDTSGRVLFVGDAARATDPMTGEGIGQALETGVLAAEAVLKGGPGAPGQAAALYDARVRKGMAVDNNLAALLSRALKHRKGARGAIRVAGSTAWTRRNFARWLFEDYPRAVLATPQRWHRHMLSGPGAYRD